MKRMLTVLMIIAMSLPVAMGFMGCDEDDSPKDKCENLVEAYCDRAADCSSDITFTACMLSTKAYIDCDDATGITPHYDICMTDIRNVSCASILQSLPGSCVGVIE